jgi:general secretion pathway protein I
MTSVSSTSLREAGFTLIEVLIALAIIAIALAATLRATAMATTSADEVRLRTYATWVAQNRAAELTARRVFPSTGVENGSVEMGGIQFDWRQTNSETPNSAFRKAEIAVSRSENASNAANTRAASTNAAGTGSAYQLVVMTVYLARPPGTGGAP